VSLRLSEDEFSVVKKVAAALGLQVITADRSTIPWEYLQEHLVDQAGIATRLRVDRAAVTQWKHLYDDWPEPVLWFPSWTGKKKSWLYWWPDIEEFCGRHEFTPGRGMRRGRPPQDRPGQA
jgi:hypothetical protein